MRQASISSKQRRKQSLCSGVIVALLLGAAPLQAESLHALWSGEGSTLLIDRMLTTLAEDPRSNRLLLSVGTEQLRSLLQQRFCLAAGTTCRARAPAAAGLLLPPAEVELLLQHLTASMQAQHIPLQQQQRLLEQLSLRGAAAEGARPLASL